MPTYVLSIPPSVNQLYANVRKPWARLATTKPSKKRGRVKTRAYSAWIDGELKALVAQRAKPVEPPVSVAITRPSRSKMDIDAVVKPTIDLLVRAGLIEDDNPSIVTSVSVNFGNVENMAVKLEHVEGEYVPAAPPARRVKGRV